MTRGVRAVVAMALCGIAVGCVGVNPRWDERERAASEGGESTDTDGTDAGAGETSTAPASAADTATVDASSTGDVGSSSGSTGAMQCPPDRGLCDGECRKILSDAHHCGEACVDCEDVPGSDGKCQQGVCHMMGEGKAEDG
ncbi:MAG: hypothetical protein IPH07_14345 [Deltaproteobacteria bacterium]|nr:hypothetical protein [Deltaproteobacteria bacterium]MBK8717470.1 hypothetical protein [Deltaproteobacteria bacterium]MBP7289612.1 hypothetical protein [Nannocystaceae bacterium]